MAKFLLTRTSGEGDEKIIEINSIEELITLLETEGRNIILRWNYNKEVEDEPEYTLEIYDDYRE